MHNYEIFTEIQKNSYLQSGPCLRCGLGGDAVHLDAGIVLKLGLRTCPVCVYRM